MRSMQLTIQMGNQSRQIEANPQGMTIGRSSSCDIVLDSPNVSRRHARILGEPSNGWRIEDLGSSNGTFINGRRVTFCPIVPGDTIEVGPFCLSLGSASENMQTSPSQRHLPRIVVEDYGAEVFYDKPRLNECPARPCPERLDELSERLAGLGDLMSVYEVVCQMMAEEPNTAAVVFQVSSQDESAPKGPEVLTCHLGIARKGRGGRPGDGVLPSHLALRVSHRLLEVVRKESRPLMTKSIFSCDTEITISLIDEHSPRAVICVPLVARRNTLDLLYVDVPIEEHIRVGPEEMFAFVQAVGQHVEAAASRMSRETERVQER